jgi:hypothetical protein
MCPEYFVHAEDSPFSLAIRPCPLTNEGDIVREKLSSVVPHFKVGHSAVENEVSFI